VTWVWVPPDRDYVLIPKAWDRKRVMQMNHYITGLIDLLQLTEGPDELGILEICEEIDEDPEMFSAVWAHLYTWQRNRIRDIRDAHRRRQTPSGPLAVDFHGRAVRSTEGGHGANGAESESCESGDG
jgi:hypothetical protein